MRWMIFVIPVLFLANLAPAGSFGRFAVEADIPVGFVMGPAPGNDDGRRFADQNGGELRVWARVPDAPLEDHRALMLTYLATEQAQIVYEASGWGWYEVSGLRDDRIFYIRVEDGLSCLQGGARAALDFSYPVETRARYDAMVEPVAKSLGFPAC